AGSADGAGSRGSSQLVLDVVSGPSVGSSDGASSLVATNQSWLLSLSLDVSLSGESADGGGSQMDTHDNQLDELNSQVPSGGQIGAAPNSPGSLSGA
ncbi:unnamed protein product, partial [Porites evermanni]